MQVLETVRVVFKKLHKIRFSKELRNWLLTPAKHYLTSFSKIFQVKILFISTCSHAKFSLKKKENEHSDVWTWTTLYERMALSAGSMIFLLSMSLIDLFAVKLEWWLTSVLWNLNFYKVLAYEIEVHIYI